MRAQEYLKAIMSSDSDYYQPDATDGYQSILRRASSRWSDPETGAVFGDYFFLEALVRAISGLYVFMIHEEGIGDGRMEASVIWFLLEYAE